MKHSIDSDKYFFNHIKVVPLPLRIPFSVDL